MSTDKFPSYAEIHHELEKYKDTVKQLAFEMEMQSKDGVDTAIRVQQIRKMALEQAAEYVMDYGIPKSGADLEKLCDEIKKLKETRAMGIQRGLDAMNAAFGSKQ